MDIPRAAKASGELPAFYDIFGPRDHARLSTLQRRGLDINAMVARGYVAHFLDIGPDYMLVFARECAVPMP